MIARIVALGLVFGLASVAWLTLGGVTTARTHTQADRLGPEVAELWGQPHHQGAPAATFLYEVEREVQRTETHDGQTRQVTEVQKVVEERPALFSSTDVKADLGLDQRLKGLMWYPLFNVDFAGRWTYTHRDDRQGRVRLAFRFPDPSGLYDGFRFSVNGEDLASRLQPTDGQVTAEIAVQPKQVVTLEVSYRSRGMSQWVYRPSTSVASLEDFKLRVSTDFDAIDFPAQSISPSAKSPQARGWKLDWTFAQVVTGQTMGVLMPERIQPGELAAALSFSAPISLLFFMLVLFVLGTLRRIDIHPVNYLFLAGAFFAFHLLFAYSVDHLSLVPAFVLCSVVSLVLVVTYLRLVVSSRFAFVEAGLAQLVYLVGFSLAHFWDGFTGLTVTVLSIVTLFVLMQLTGRVRWSEVFTRTAPRAAPPAAAVGGAA